MFTWPGAEFKHTDEVGVTWYIIMDWGPFWMGANWFHRIIRIHLPQWYAELTIECEETHTGEECFIADFAPGVEHECLHLAMGDEGYDVELEHRLIERLTGVDWTPP